MILTNKTAAFYSSQKTNTGAQMVVSITNIKRMKYTLTNIITTITKNHKMLIFLTSSSNNIFNQINNNILTIILLVNKIIQINKQTDSKSQNSSKNSRFSKFIKSIGCNKSKYNLFNYKNLKATIIG